MERYLTVRQAMQMLPLGKTTLTAIFHELNPVTNGRKLLVTERALEGWIARHTASGRTAAEAEKKKPSPKRKDALPWLTPDGRIPTRKELEKMQAEARKKGGKT